MMTMPGATEAVHLGVDDIPWVELGDGSLMRLLQVRIREGLWIVHTRFNPGYEVQTHKHTGPVWGYTNSGAWKYKEYDYVNRAGSFLYEPAGSVHTHVARSASARRLLAEWRHYARVSDDREGADSAGLLAVVFLDLVHRVQHAAIRIDGEE